MSNVFPNDLVAALDATGRSWRLTRFEFCSPRRWEGMVWERDDRHEPGDKVAIFEHEDLVVVMRMLLLLADFDERLGRWPGAEEREALLRVATSDEEPVDA